MLQSKILMATAGIVLLVNTAGCKLYESSYSGPVEAEEQVFHEEAGLLAPGQESTEPCTISATYNTEKTSLKLQFLNTNKPDPAIKLVYLANGKSLSLSEAIRSIGLNNYLGEIEFIWQEQGKSCASKLSLEVLEGVQELLVLRS